jgi:hypothetical protein
MILSSMEILGSDYENSVHIKNADILINALLACSELCPEIQDIIDELIECARNRRNTPDLYSVLHPRLLSLASMSYGKSDALSKSVFMAFSSIHEAEGQINKPRGEVEGW